MSASTARTVSENALGDKRDGFVLIVVLGAVLMLSVLLFGFHQRVRTRFSGAQSFYTMERLWNVARAGVSVVVGAVAECNDLSSDRRFEKLLAGETALEIGGVTCRVTVVEESGLLNVNGLKSRAGEIDRGRVDQLLRLLDLLNRASADGGRIGYGIVPAVIDWTDADNDVTRLPFVSGDNLGAEDSYYRTLSPPYRCSNNPMYAIDELRSVKGVTPEAFGRLRECVTVFGDGLVNINAAPKLVLECLSEQMSPAVAQMILSRRALRPFASIAELQEVPGMTDNVYRAMKDSITVKPPQRHYRVVSRATVEDLSFAIEAVLRRNTQAGNVDIVLYREL